ncbi:zinc-ribbon domain-containing protein [Muriicola sp. Z0-33]|uniref:zinc-ribbon domain-containing protein n=1 Tax=Muriicola sp. Z0-33 TaxID=2816957 RepID=UPI0022374A8C|nr:zinc-ribbon domain-containing protein [Muriicola sp. Z0-33]MCW5516073.1 zinc-ribbon domain-containing protein [Muriicola sp. Z0-33]
MILFFGTRPGKAEHKNLSNLTCPHCQQRHTLTATLRPNYFHLFWLPLFRVSTWRFIGCDHCKRVYYKDEFTDEMVKALEY